MDFSPSTSKQVEEEEMIKSGIYDEITTVIPPLTEASFLINTGMTSTKGGYLIQRAVHSPGKGAIIFFNEDLTHCQSLFSVGGIVDYLYAYRLEGVLTDPEPFGLDIKALWVKASGPNIELRLMNNKLDLSRTVVIHIFWIAFGT